VSRRERGLGAGAGRAAARLLVCAAAAAALAGCFSERLTEPSGGTVSFASDVQPILTGSCAFSGCHGTVNANPGGKPMVLAAGQAYDNMVGVAALELPAMQRIRAGQPDASYVIHKLQNTHKTVGGSGDRMPLGSAPLSQAQIDLIRTWVANGAPRN
jgi:hypothetical protein